MKTSSYLSLALAAALILAGCTSATSGNKAPDTTAPTVLSVLPLDLATSVPADAELSAIFSEALDATTVTTSSVTLVHGTPAVAVTGTVSFEGTTAAFHPAAFLVNSTVYTLKISTVVKDKAGNALAAAKQWSFTTSAAGINNGPAPVFLGTAGSFVILAKTGVSTVPASVITGNVGLSPAAETFLTGFSLTDATGWATSTQVTGLLYAADMTPPTPSKMTTAVSDMETAYTDAAGRSNSVITNTGAGEIGGLTLVPGLYNWNTNLTISNNLTLNGGSNDIWIFQVTGTLALANAKQVILPGGAKAKNIYWQVTQQVSLGTTSHFEGIILGKTLIEMKTGSTMIGRALAQSAVTLDQTTVTKPAN